jgi:hypothetical protein
MGFLGILGMNEFSSESEIDLGISPGAGEKEDA